MKHFIIDVESIGLHGEGFAFGYVVLEPDGTELEFGYAACPPINASGTELDRRWVDENAVPFLPTPTHETPRGVRDYFWSTWSRLRDGDVLLWADCAWPVEANFISACIRDDLEYRNWLGPYPLNEISTVLRLAGLDPIGIFDRLENEKPAHHPTNDARQSGRLLMENLEKLNG